MSRAGTTDKRALRLWPGVVIVALQWPARFVLPAVDPDLTGVGVMGGLAGGLLVVLWWVFFSRAPWSERLGVPVVMAVALFATSRVAHESITTGAMGMLLPLLATPILSLALVAWAIGGRGLSNGPRWATMAATALVASGSLTLVRTGGFTGSFDNDLHWRWSETPEERLLALADDEPPAPVPAPASVKAPEDAVGPTGATEAGDKSAVVTTPPEAAAKNGADWTGFRGRDRDSVLHGVRIGTDWTESPPVELWRRPIGPGWSSFAVSGDLLYTQEQRGDDEVVAAYSLTNGKPVWRHSDATRFWESNGGAGPRATPTLHNGRVYALGATGILNALDAAGGAVVWSRNAATDTGAKLPIWGFAGSPLVVDGLVIVAASGTLAAYDAATGTPRWLGGPADGEAYSSPHLQVIAGIPQILFVNAESAAGFSPFDGKVLWQHSWRGGSIVQPAITAEGDVLITSTTGARRIAIARKPEGWTVEERWTSIGLKPYFNDFVVHKSHAYGFDGSILASIDLADGKRKWKGGRYGNGQLMLLPEQDLLLVVSEQGEFALVKATPDQFTEIARFPAIEGKTWNHPVMAGDVLLVRNGEEMAAFRLPLAGP